VSLLLYLTFKAAPWLPTRYAARFFFFQAFEGVVGDCHSSRFALFMLLGRLLLDGLPPTALDKRPKALDGD
jgi:hypothetical protein